MTQTEMSERSDRAPTANAPRAARQPRAPETEAIYVPDVDIFEDGNRIRLVADMPGVEQGSAHASIENGVLTIEGKAQAETPAGHELVGQEYGVGRYRREFTLSEAMDTEGIKARMKQGVLEVTLPKRDLVKTKKIEIAS